MDIEKSCRAAHPGRSLTSFLFRKKKLNLKTQLPVRSELRFFHIIIGCQLGVDRLATDAEKFADATAERYCPGVVTVCFPISRDYRSIGQMPAFGEVVVDEVLPGEAKERLPQAATPGQSMELQNPGLLDKVINSERTTLNRKLRQKVLSKP